MSESCSHNCSTCGSDCGERTQESLLAPLHELSSVKKVFAVVSGKGGVGKSLVTSLLASATQKSGAQTAILDADITGPSIPTAFGLHTRAFSNGTGMLPVETKSGIEVMSLNLLLEEETAPVVWRGPVIAGAVKQFWSEVVWEDVDCMYVDMPPGTGDVPLTVFQSLPIDGIIIVTSPQDLVSMVVEKALRMAQIMKIPVVAIVENMSYYECPDCGKRHSIFGESHLEETAARYGIPRTARIPIDPSLAAACDAGEIESVDIPALDELAKALQEL